MRTVALALVWLLGTCCITTAVNADTETFPLKFVKASTVLKHFEAKRSVNSPDQTPPSEIRTLLPEGIREITGSDRDKSLTAEGTPDALRELGEIVRLLDIKPRKVRLKVELVRFRYTYNNIFACDIQTVATPVFLTQNNTVVPIKVKGGTENYTLSLQPRILADNTITLFAREINLQNTLASKKIASSAQITRSVPSGRKTTLFGVTDSTNEAVLRSVAKGQSPTVLGNYTVYYLHIIPTILPLNAPKEQRDPIHLVHSD